MRYEIIQGDCIEGMKTLPDQSVHMCVTSPPYFGLRDYGTSKWEGGDPDCDHKKPNVDIGNIAKPTLGGGKATNAAQIIGYRGVCRKCGAVCHDGQIGLEETPDAFVAKLVDVFREVRRVLRDDGTLWLNLGDSYASANATIGRNDEDRNDRNVWAYGSAGHGRKANGAPRQGSINRLGCQKPKDLIGIPWRVAFALQADGWYLRQDIIWHKPNPMPESVRDRCTKAHEYIFLLSKSARYYYDAAAIAEKAEHPKMRHRSQSVTLAQEMAHLGNAPTNLGRCGTNEDGTRNRRSVWTVTTRPYKGAHFATFPPDLIRPCILAGCPVDGTVLDPFGGSGTTAQVAIEEGRNAILCELNEEYIKLAHKRISGTQLKIH